jgi:anti-sigma factor ChrR (cupin superfamily)
MHLNDDLTARTVVHGGKLDWIPSPSKGIDRRMLFRVGDEKARATSIVRYAPQSQFPRHSHPGGEEFLVLEGVFQDENGDYRAGSYIRNPPGSSHAPRSASGCVIFVRLWQFRKEDDVSVVRLAEEKREGSRPDSNRASSKGLFHSAFEDVSIKEWGPGAAVELPNLDGLELLVLSGGFTDGA